MIAPYASSANDRRAFRASRANNSANESTTNGIMPKPPSQAAGDGTFEAPDLAAASEFTMSTHQMRDCPCLKDRRTRAFHAARETPNEQIGVGRRCSSHQPCTGIRDRIDLGSFLTVILWRPRVAITVFTKVCALRDSPESSRSPRGRGDQ